MNETRSVQIHPQAVVDPKAELASGVVIGPGAVVGLRCRSARTAGLVRMWCWRAG